MATENVGRVIQVIGPGFEIHPYVLAMVDVWSSPIKLDPAWNGGDYTAAPEKGSFPMRALPRRLTAISADWGSGRFSGARS